MGYGAALGGTATARTGDPRQETLVALGKRRGFVTIDEIDAHLPDHIVAAADIEAWLAVLHGHGIEVLDAAAAPASSSLPRSMREVAAA
jgi:hypothetical protein